MKLVIDIPENMKKLLDDHDAVIDWLDTEHIVSCVRNGKPLDDLIDKIRTEIEQEYNCLSVTRADETLELGECLGLKMALKIIDKYKAESEE